MKINTISILEYAFDFLYQNFDIPSSSTKISIQASYATAYFGKSISNIQILILISIQAPKL